MSTRPHRIVLLAILVAGCGRTARFPDVDLPSLRGADRDGFDPIFAPSATPTPPIGFGDGSDGDVTISSAVAPNSCYAVTAISGAVLDVQPANTTFSAGSRLLLLQVKYGSFASGGQSPIGEGTNRAGRWDVFTVSSVATGHLTLDVAPSAEYTPSARVQACSMPQYDNLTVQAPLKAALWNGSTGVGGVLAFFVAGTLEVSDSVNADAEGFVGGAGSLDDPAPSTETANDTSVEDGGGKGEGIAAPSADAKANGRGNYANGAGGGNSRRAGGGGGANAGAGGYGGNEYSTIEGQGNPATRGMGGAALFGSFSTRLTMGGGGGGGHGDLLAVPQGPGGRGGGIVLIFAERIRGSGTIAANGANGTGTNGVTLQTDAAGGGGAGGTVAITFQNDDGFDGSITAWGGNGGNPLGSSMPYVGGGGGGGGGRVVLSGPTLGGARDVHGGQNGKYNVIFDHGATEGLPGWVVQVP